MPTKKPTTKSTSAAFEGADQPENIRNVALVGHAGAGKTTLVEAMLAFTGVITRAGSVPEGSTVSDNDPVEIAQQRSVSLSLCPLRHGDVVLNLLDTPGYPDFTGELRAGLRAADAVLFVVSASDDIDPVTVSLWEECTAAGKPRAVAISRLDAPRSSFAAAVEGCQRVFGGADAQAVLPLYVTVGSSPEAAPTGMVDLLTQTVSDYSGGFPPSTAPLTAEDAVDDDVETARAALLEGIIEKSEDEALLDQYLSGEEIAPEVLAADLRAALAKGAFHPALPVCAATGLGIAELLELLAGSFPSPVEAAPPAVIRLDGSRADDVRGTADGPLVGQVVRTSVDPYLGRLTVLRLYSGTLAPDVAIHIVGRGGEDRGHADHDTDERVGQLFSPLGATLRPVEQAVAGDVCAIGRLSSAETGDTISTKAVPLFIEPWQTPEPLLPVAVQAATRADEDALAKGLGRLTAGDPTLRIERHPETGQLVLWCLGEAHADVVLERLRAAGAHVDTVPLKVALRETFASEGRGHGRLVKQSGGHGQYAVCDIVVSPLPPGSGIQFQDKVVGGAVPSQFIGSVEKGARNQLEQGLANDHVRVVDVMITLVDGKAHSVDSSDAAFQMAGGLAVKEAAAKASLALLEPLATIDVIVPDTHVGAVLSDLSGRRGRVTGTEPDPTALVGMERTVVHAEVPDAELSRYAVTLRSLTAGTGRFTRAFARYQVVPANVAATLRTASSS
ncbi:MAG: elongation factor G-like protein EF-G2 [Actinomycetia bacterium]|nr:elongation factor G-like protein EF-G2 [Actinomycetes bacterium]